MLINNAAYQRETLSERPIRQPLILHNFYLNPAAGCVFHLWFCFGNVDLEHERAPDNLRIILLFRFREIPYK